MRTLLLVCSLMITGQVWAIDGLSAGPALIVNPCTTNSVISSNGFSASPTATTGACGNKVALPSISKTGVYDVAKAGTIASATANDKNCALTGASSSTACYDFSTAVPLPGSGGATTAPIENNNSTM